jgi:trans-aconitate methyltransferase
MYNSITPSLAFKFGFANLREDAAKLDAYETVLAHRVANADSPPEWLPTSVFRPDTAP